MLKIANNINNLCVVSQTDICNSKSKRNEPGGVKWEVSGGGRI